MKELKKDFWRHVEPSTEAPNVFCSELALSVKNFRNNAGCSENVQEVFLLQVIRQN